MRPGSDADIVVYDPGLSHVIEASDCVANVDYNPYEGFVTAGGIRQVWLNGRLCVNQGTVLDRNPAGSVHCPRKMLPVSKKGSRQMPASFFF